MGVMNDTELLHRQKLALQWAREAGDITLRYFRNDDLAVERKDDATPVTIADRQAELFLRDAIAAALPDDAVLGEEFPETPGTSGYRWILDPIDGTKSFISGVPLYGTLVGVEHERRSVIGVIHIPALAETIYAARGHGAWYVRGDREPVRSHLFQETTGRRTALHLGGENVRHGGAIASLRTPTGRDLADSHVGRLLWLSARRHRPGRGSHRSEDEPVGLRRCNQCSKKRAAHSPIGKANRRSTPPRPSPRTGTSLTKSWRLCATANVSSQRRTIAETETTSVRFVLETPDATFHPGQSRTQLLQPHRAC